MSEEDFVKKSIEAVSELVNSILDLSVDSFERDECYIKASELTFWLNQYYNTNFDGGRDE